MNELEFVSFRLVNNNLFDRFFIRPRAGHGANQIDRIVDDDGLEVMEFDRRSNFAVQVFVVGSKTSTGIMRRPPIRYALPLYATNAASCRAVGWPVA